MVETGERMSFFWTHHEDAPHAACSQFYPRPMMIEAIRFVCCEQWMHWRKAMLFGDEAKAAAILAEPVPLKQKRLGRAVANFSVDAWNAVSRDVVFRGNIAKFSQHPDLLERLRVSCGTTLVEASPYDRLWGIGLAADDPRAWQRASWLGKNWLGEVLTETRIALCGS
jgi:ribA/ribD-fused uncharacterized protein